MTGRRIEYAPISARPMLARRLVAIWREQHLCKGDGLTVYVLPGEWPGALPCELQPGVEVREEPDWEFFRRTEAAEGCMAAIGRTPSGATRLSMTIFPAEALTMSRDEQALMTLHLDAGDEEATLWMAPSPIDGSIPTWTKRRGSP